MSDTDTEAAPRAPAVSTTLVVALLVGVIALTVGTFVGTRLSRPPGDASPEAGFARDMSAHHLQAVEMAEILRTKSEDPEMLALATDIVLTQQAQVGQMRGWLDVWRLPPSRSTTAMAWMGHRMNRSSMPGMASREEVAELRDLGPAEAEVRFLQLMIPHHRGGVDMAKAVIERTGRAEVVALAGAIVSTQQSEVRNMQALLRARGATE